MENHLPPKKSVWKFPKTIFEKPCHHPTVLDRKPFQPRNSNLSDVCSIPQVLQLLPIGTSWCWCFFRHFSKAQLGGSLQQIHAGALLGSPGRGFRWVRGVGVSLGTFFTAGKFQVATWFDGNCYWVGKNHLKWLGIRYTPLKIHMESSKNITPALKGGENHLNQTCMTLGSKC